MMSPGVAEAVRASPQGMLLEAAARMSLDSQVSEVLNRAGGSILGDWQI